MNIKKYLAGSLLALLTLTTACTNEELAVNNGNGTDTEELPAGAVQFKIDGITTGAVATRNLNGTVIATAQENRVDHLLILVFGSEKENASNTELTFRDYWTSEKRTDFICDKEKKTFALKGMGKYYTATILVPTELKTTKFMFIANKPRIFDLMPMIESMNLTGTLPELSNMYMEGDEHLHIGYPLEGHTIDEILGGTLVFCDAIDGVGVPDGYTQTVPNTLPCLQVPFEMENDYLGFIPGRRETLSMTGISSETITADGQSMSVTLVRNVARLDVSVDGGIKLKELKLTNVGALNMMGGAGLPFDFSFDGTGLCSTFSLMKTDAEGQPYVPERSYCYPMVVPMDGFPDNYEGLKLTGKLEDDSPFEIPFVDNEFRLPIEVKSNHRYTIKLRRTADNYIDANIVVEDWKVGEEIEVDPNEGDDETPTLSNVSNYEYATWEGTGKVVCMVSDNYSLNSVNPAVYPWLRFDTNQMMSMGLRMYYKDQEVNYPGPLFDPNMKVYTSTESDNGTVHHELMVTQPTVSTQWLKVQNNFKPELNHVVKVETGNMEATGINAKTPALIAFAETNVDASGNALIAFPAGGFDGPYCTPVTDWSAYCGKEEKNTTVSVAGYALPTAKQLQCIAPDPGRGKFGDYNGSTVKEILVDKNTTVYYSGSKLDGNVVRVVVDRSQTGDELGTAPEYVNVEATLWHNNGKYLRINQVNISIPGKDVGSLTSYTALMDLFNNGRAVSAGYTRFFPMSQRQGEAVYLGEGGSALIFDYSEVRFEASYSGNGFIRPVISTMRIPAREPVQLP